jgi:PTH1 family peptidyl-tRNA hydrolase
MKLIAGLGNPGEKYQHNRHNIGFMAIDKLAQESGVKFKKEAIFEADVANFFLNQEKIYLVKPTTFMNNSGRAITALLTYYNVLLEDFIVIYDDLDLAVGKLRLRLKGSAGGHNGVKSIISYLKTQEFNRIKVGVGRPSHNHSSVVNYVLGDFPKVQEPQINSALTRTVSAIDYYLAGHSFQEVINKFNLN